MLSLVKIPKKMKVHKVIIFFLSIFLVSTAYTQKTLSEGSIIYNMAVETGSDAPKMADMLDGATTTVFLKGKQSRVDLVSSLGSEASIYNAATQSGFILKDYSGQKLLITLTQNDWESNYKKYEGIVFENTGETNVISGYSCRKVNAKLKNGTIFTVWYTTDVTPANKEYDPQFKSLPGLAVQYEMTYGKMKFKFTLSKVSFEAVSSSKFEMPKSGYRIMTFEETKK